MGRERRQNMCEKKDGMRCEMMKEERRQKSEGNWGRNLCEMVGGRGKRGLIGFDGKLETVRGRKRRSRRRRMWGGSG